MNWKDALAMLKGYRTHIATTISILSTVATVAGLLPTTQGAAIAATCIALAQMFQRFATGEASKKLDELLGAINEAPPGSVLPFPPPAETSAKAGLILFALLLLSQTGQAALPRAVIQGNEAGVAGEILILDASLSEGTPTHFRWTVEPRIEGRRQLVAADGGDLDTQTSSKVQVATIPGRYLVRVTVSNADGNHEGTRLIVIPGAFPQPIPPPVPPVPTPEPTPNPNPQPQPVPPPAPGPGPPPGPEPVPAGRFGLAQATLDLVAGIVSPG